MTGWYVLYKERERGPLSKEQFADFVRGKNPDDLHVWREGLDAWVPAAKIPTLVQHMRAGRRWKLRWAAWAAIAGALIGVFRIQFGTVTPRDPVYLVGFVLGNGIILSVLGFVAGTIADSIWGTPSSGAVNREFRFNNVVAKHWRGQLSLWISYWVVGLLASFAVALVPIAFGKMFKSGGYYPPAIFAALYFSWAALVMIVVWEYVGIWRSATNYIAQRRIAGRRAFWGGLAQASVAIGVLSSIASFGLYGIPQLKEVFRITFLQDPSIPSYSIRIIGGGTAAEIVGGFKYGLTDDFERLLETSGRINVVHLDSIGGRVGEGEKLYKLIREKGLSTYVPSKCMSACTVAFAGGKERYLEKSAVLGFHRGTFPGAPEGELDETQRKVFMDSGFDGSFVQIALSTPHKDMWKPSADVLLKSRVITSVVEGGRFARSGFRDPSGDRLGAPD